MRWDRLFDDLESQIEQELGAEEHDLRVEEERLRIAALTLRERIIEASRSDARALDGPDAQAAPVSMIVSGGRRVQLEVRSVGRDWVNGRLSSGVGSGRQAIIPLHAITAVAVTRSQLRHSLGLDRPEDRAPGGTASEASRLERAVGAVASPAARLGVGYMLRDLCRRRSPVEIHLLSAQMAFGTIDRVARDHLDLAVHESGSARRERDIDEYHLIAFAAIEMVVI